MSTDNNYYNIKKIYIAGPMTGYAEYNYPEFFNVEKALNDKNIKNINPARITDSMGGQQLFVENKELADKIIIEQQRQERTCDAILLLDGWQNSKGTLNELKVALDNNLKIYLKNELV